MFVSQPPCIHSSEPVRTVSKDWWFHQAEGIWVSSPPPAPACGETRCLRTNPLMRRRRTTCHVRREFVLTTKREGLVHPAVALLVASVVPELQPPAPPRPPAQSIGAG